MLSITELVQHRIHNPQLASCDWSKTIEYENEDDMAPINFVLVVVLVFVLVNSNNHAFATRNP
jgi:hypothetical protein